MRKEAEQFSLLATAYSLLTIELRSMSTVNENDQADRAISTGKLHGWIRLAPIVQYSPLLPPVGVWAVSQSQCG